MHNVNELILQMTTFNREDEEILIINSAKSILQSYGYTVMEKSKKMTDEGYVVLIELRHEDFSGVFKGELISNILYGTYPYISPISYKKRPFLTDSKIKLNLVNFTSPKLCDTLLMLLLNNYTNNIITNYNINFRYISHLLNNIVVEEETDKFTIVRGENVVNEDYEIIVTKDEESELHIHLSYNTPLLANVVFKCSSLTEIYYMDKFLRTLNTGIANIEIKGLRFDEIEKIDKLTDYVVFEPIQIRDELNSHRIQFEIDKVNIPLIKGVMDIQTLTLSLSSGESIFETTYNSFEELADALISLDKSISNK